MNEFEKDILKLMEIHEKADKGKLIKRLNDEISNSDRKQGGKTEWVCEVTGSPIGTVWTWFTYAKCREKNKIPLRALCQLAIALKISIWDFYMDTDIAEEEGELKINRKDKLYWHLRRNEAEKRWNNSYGCYGIWEWQSKEVQRKFIDELYLERLEEQRLNQSIV